MSGVWKKIQLQTHVISLYFSFFFFLLGPQLWYMEVPRLAVKSELQLHTYGYDHSHSNAGSETHLQLTLQLNPLSEARYWTQILMDTVRFLTQLSYSVNPYFSVFWLIYVYVCVCVCVCVCVHMCMYIYIFALYIFFCNFFQSLKKCMKRNCFADTKFFVFLLLLLLFVFTVCPNLLPFFMIRRPPFIWEKATLQLCVFVRLLIL